MLRLIPRAKAKLTKRRQPAPSRVKANESPLEIRRVLSAVTASVDISAHGMSTSTADSNIQLQRAYQAAQEARVVNGTSTSDYQAVGVVNDGCTGTLIAPDVVLTAAHCVEGNNGGIIGDTEGTFEVNGQVYTTTKVTVHPNYNPNDFGAGYDIAIMKLNRPVQGVTPYDINRTTPQVGQTLTLVGFGETGSSTSGSNGDFGNKTVGQTTIDEVTQTHVSWNFNSHNESNTAPGDSGGPAFLNVGGKLVVAGITSGGDGDAHTLGDYSFDTRVDTLASWIDQVAGTTTGGSGDTGGGGGQTGGSSSAIVSSNGSVAIPDNNVATVTSVAQASGLNGSITDVNVALDIAHTWNEDLQVTLISPSGTRIELFDGIGGDSSNFAGTVLDDQAGQSISNGDAPFSGSYRPGGDLSQLNGEDPNGTWTLEVRDHFEEDGGRINSFSVEITTDGANPGGGTDGGDTNGDGGTGGGNQNTLSEQAIAIDETYGLQSNGNYFENWGGKGEKWMQSDSGWVFITPDGSLFEWTGNGANGTLVAKFNAEYHANPALLHDAFENSQTSGGAQSDLTADAIRIDQEYGLRSDGNLWEDWAGLDEKWMQSDIGWMYITPKGGLYLARTDELVHQFSSSFHETPSLLFNAYDNASRQQRDQEESDELFAELGSDNELLCVL